MQQLWNEMRECDEFGRNCRLKEVYLKYLDPLHRALLFQIRQLKWTAALKDNSWSASILVVRKVVFKITGLKIQTQFFVFFCLLSGAEISLWVSLMGACYFWGIGVF